MSRKIPREVYIQYVRDLRTGGTHNVLEVCRKDTGVRFVMAQDSETAKERDRYKLRANLLEAENAALREALHEIYGKACQAMSEDDDLYLYSFAKDARDIALEAASNQTNRA